MRHFTEGFRRGNDKLVVSGQRLPQGLIKMTVNFNVGLKIKFFYRERFAVFNIDEKV